MITEGIYKITCTSRIHRLPVESVGAKHTCDIIDARGVMLINDKSIHFEAVKGFPIL